VSDLPCDTEPKAEAAAGAGGFGPAVPTVGIPGEPEGPECPGGQTVLGPLRPPSGKHEWGNARPKVGVAQQVCGFCGARRAQPVQPPGAVQLEARHGDVLRLGPKVESQARPSDLKRNRLSLREKMAQLAQQGGRVKQLDRAEAQQMGFDAAEIAEVWPNP
jgi:hypothetical protein